MLLYQDVFNPIFFLLLCAFIVIYLDWKIAGGKLTTRIITVIGSWIVAYTIYRMYFVLFPESPQWIEDLFAVAGLIIAASLTYYIWKKKNYGKEMIGAIVATVSVVIPYTLISPFWNISGHVAFTTAPVVYLYTLDKKFVWLFFVPIIMLVNRPVVNAHTIEESVCGFILGLLALTGTWYIRRSKHNEK